MKIIRTNTLSFIPASHEDPTKPGSLKKVLVKKDDIREGRLQMVNWSLLPAGKSFQPHYHEDMDEIFVIIKGSALITSGGETALVGMGDSVVIPAGEIHEMKNNTTDDVYYIAMGVASGINGKTVTV